MSKEAPAASEIAGESRPLLSVQETSGGSPRAAESGRVAEQRCVVLQRGVALFVGCCVILCTGSLFGFSAYSGVLKETLGFTGKQVNLIVATGLFGMNVFGFWNGFLVDNVGPRLTLLYGASLVFIGYINVFLQFQLRYSRSATLMALFYTLLGHGSHALYLASLNTNVRNFAPRQRVIVTGGLQMCFGLSSAFFTNVYKLGFSSNRNLAGFLILYSLLIPLVGVFGAIFVRRLPPKSLNDHSIEAILSAEDEARLVRIRGRFHRGRSGMLLLKSVRYVLAFIGVMFTTSITLLFLNNLKLIFRANRVPDETTLVFVTFTSYANAVGRFIFASLAAICSASRIKVVQANFCQPFFLALSAVLAAVSCVLLLIQGPLLFPAAVFLPLAYGSMYGVLPTWICLRFGEKWFGFNYGVMGMGGAFGTFSFGLIAGALYDHFSHGETFCTGPSCYSYTFLMCLVAASVSAICLVLVWLRERRRILLEHVNEAKEDAADEEKRRIASESTSIETKELQRV